MRIVILGLSITSSWGNGHATTFRSLVRALTQRGHDVLFLERDVPWYRENRDLPHPPYGRTGLYESLQDLQGRFLKDVNLADAIIVGSYVPEGIAVAKWVLANAGGLTAFYDIDTPVTMAAIEKSSCEYLNPDLIPKFQLYLSFTGGPTLEMIERRYGSPMARALYCSVDPDIYRPVPMKHIWDLGYLGTYSDDRQQPLEQLMLEPARQARDLRFVVAGPLYPESIAWPENCRRISHLPPTRHCAFYNAQRFTLNITRHAMVQAGYSPSVRLFEAAACGTAVISDEWDGLDSIFEIGEEILTSSSSRETLVYLRELPAPDRHAISQRARQRVLAEHTAQHRAQQLEDYLRHAQVHSPA